HRARVGEVGVARIDPDSRDAIGIFEPDVRPGFAAVVAAVHPVAERGVVARILFAGADIDDVGIRRGELDRADRDDVLVVEDRLPGRAAVGRFEDAAVGARYVEAEWIPGHADDHRDASRLVRRTDVSEGQALERLHLRRLRRLLRA